MTGQIGRQGLDRHLALQARVLGGVDDPYAAVAQFGADRIRAERGTWSEGHGRGWIIRPYPSVEPGVTAVVWYRDDEVQGWKSSWTRLRRRTGRRNSETA